MEWIGLIVVVIALVAAAALWGFIHAPKHGAVTGCCRCGACIATGECVMVKKRTKRDKAA